MEARGRGLCATVSVSVFASVSVSVLLLSRCLCLVSVFRFCCLCLVTFSLPLSRFPVFASFCPVSLYRCLGMHRFSVSLERFLVCMSVLHSMPLAICFQFKCLSLRRSISRTLTGSLCSCTSTRGVGAKKGHILSQLTPSACIPLPHPYRRIHNSSNLLPDGWKNGSGGNSQ